MTAAKKRRKECVMKKRIVSLLCAGLLVFSEPYPTLAAQSAGTEAITDHSEEVPCADDSGSGDESSPGSEDGSTSERLQDPVPGRGRRTVPGTERRVIRETGRMEMEQRTSGRMKLLENCRMMEPG